MDISRRNLVVGSASAAGLAGFPAIVRAQQKIEVKVANFVPPGHFMSQWLVKWGEGLEKQSGGRLAFKHFPGAQMGPTPKHYDFARDGTAEVAYVLHGATPGRFPLTELVNMPYLVGSAEIGIKVLNDPEVKKALEAHGLTPQPTTRAELTAFMKKEDAKWSAIVKERNIKAN